jgi:hypothetical protein
VSDTLITDGKSYRIDASRWPVVVVTRLGEEMSDAQLRSSLEALDRLVDGRPEKYSLVLDQRRGLPGPAQRKLIGEHDLARAAHSRRYCRGVALVVDSLVTRGLLAATLLLRRPHVKTQLFAELEPALEWAGMLHVESVLLGRISLRP